MPHVTIKLLAGRSDAQKTHIAELVTEAIMAGASCEKSAVSVSIQDIKPDRWSEDVYNTDIAGDWDRLYQKPGYEP